MEKVIGYQVQDANGDNWADRPSYLILGLQTASADLQAARACSDRLFFMIAVLEGDIENPEFEQSRGFISDEMGMIITKTTRQTAIVDHEAQYEIDENYWQSLLNEGLSGDEALEKARAEGHAKSISFSTEMIESVMVHESDIS